MSAAHAADASGACRSMQQSGEKRGLIDQALAAASEAMRQEAAGGLAGAEQIRRQPCIM